MRVAVPIVLLCARVALASHESAGDAPALQAVRLAVAANADGTDVFVQAILAAPAATDWSLRWPAPLAAVPSTGDPRLFDGLSALTAPQLAGCAPTQGCNALGPTTLTENGGDSGWPATDGAFRLEHVETSVFTFGGAPGARVTPVLHYTLPPGATVTLPFSIFNGSTPVRFFVMVLADHRAALNTPAAHLDVSQLSMANGASNYDALVAGALHGTAFLTESAALVGPSDLTGIDLGAAGASLFANARFVTRLRGQVTAGAADATLTVSGPDDTVARRLDTCTNPASGCSSAGAAGLGAVVLALLWRRRENLL